MLTCVLAQTKVHLWACGSSFASFRKLKMELYSQGEGTETSAPPYSSRQKNHENDTSSGAGQDKMGMKMGLWHPPILLSVSSNLESHIMCLSRAKFSLSLHHSKIQTSWRVQRIEGAHPSQLQWWDCNTAELRRNGWQSRGSLWLPLLLILSLQLTDIPLCLISVYFSPPLSQSGQKKGCLDFLALPHSGSVLLTKVVTWMCPGKFGATR